MSYPFSEEIFGEKRIRKFSADVPDEELIWHRDAADRTVKVISAAGWYFQMDDELPVELKPGNFYRIPRETWHRVIKRTGHADLIVEIFEE